MAEYTLIGGAVVSGSFQRFDQEYLLEALRQLGPGFVGVTQLPVTVADREIVALAEGGVRGVRFNLRRGGSEEVVHLDRLARRVYEVAGWHAELYVDSRQLPEVAETVARLPSVSIDHLGLSREGLPHLLRLVEQGVRVKATGFGRLDFDPREALKAIHGINPQALIFGTDLPSTRAPRPFLDEDLLLVYDALGDSGAKKVLWENGVRFYRVERPLDSVD